MAVGRRRWAGDMSRVAAAAAYMLDGGAFVPYSETHTSRSGAAFRADTASAYKVHSYMRLGDPVGPFREASSGRGTHTEDTRTRIHARRPARPNPPRMTAAA